MLYADTFICTMCEAFDWVLMETKVGSNQMLQDGDGYVVTDLSLRYKRPKACLSWVSQITCPPTLIPYLQWCL